MLVAISKVCINKPTDKALFGKINRSFANVDIPLEGLADAIKQGFAFCAQHSGGNRKSDNFTASSVLAVDVDTGVRLEDALADDFIQRYGGFIYTTASHTADSHRFRIVFELEQPITDRDRMKHAMSGLTVRLGGDKACTDACRMFFGNSNANVTFIGRQLPTTEVEALIVRVPEKLEWSRSEKGAGTTTNVTVHSRITLDTDTVVRDAVGTEHRLVDLPVLTPVHCPMHLDVHPSAFTIASRKGTPGVHCKTCNATYYVTADGPYYDFDYDLRVVRSKSLEEWETESAEGDVLVFDEVRTPVGVHFICQEFLQPIQTNASVVLVRSPKGTGKTEWLRGVVSEAKQTGQSILLIGHRQSLIMATAKRLGLSPYILFADEEDGGAATVTQIPATKHYAICLDSMPSRLDPREDRYDIVIIDEIEQVLAHLTAATLRDKRQQVVLRLRFYLRNARKIYALDADLNRVTVAALPALIGDVSKTCLLLVNDWVPQQGRTHIYRGASHVVQLLNQALDDGKRCFVCSNSKRLIKTLTLALQERFGERKKLHCITSENSQLKETQDFLKALPDALLQYDALLVSPAVGTGVDITFAGRERKVDAVFGLFKARVTTHFDIDQQMCRVRHPGEVHVWVSPEKFSFETHPDLIRKELENAVVDERQVVSFDDDGRPQYSPADTIYAEIFAEVRAIQRASKNNLRENFCELRRRNGWEIVDVARDVQAARAGLTLLHRGKELLSEDHARRACAARVLKVDEYDDLRRKDEQGTLSEADASALRRYEVEAFYLQPISEELLSLDDDGRYRKAVRLYESLLDMEEPEGEWKRSRLRADVMESAQRRELLRALFASTPIFTEAGGFDTDAVVTKDDLSGLIAKCEAKRVAIERLLDLSLRNDLRNKPVQQLGVLLKLVGLRLTGAGTRKQGKEKIYLYSINSDALARIQGIVARRADQSVRKEWKRARAEPEDTPDDLREAVRRLRDRGQAVTQDEAVDDA